MALAQQAGERTEQVLRSAGAFVNGLFTMTVKVTIFIVYFIVALAMALSEQGSSGFT